MTGANHPAWSKPRLARIDLYNFPNRPNVQEFDATYPAGHINGPTTIVTGGSTFTFTTADISLTPVPTPQGGGPVS
jgi:hypothetical protein